MKLDSKLFDRIRIKPDVEKILREQEPACEWEGCDNAGTHPAPKGRGREGQYYRFCMDHVRLYNKTYNYFSGLPDDAVAEYQKDAATGHRPTWTMGMNPGAGERPLSEPGDDTRANWARKAAAARLFFRTHRFRAEAPPEPRRKLKRLEARALETLGLPETATAQDIKTRYKELVKRHHPDANGGDRSTEGRLQQVIEAYNLLRQAGLC